jgi:hypothetical protein
LQLGDPLRPWHAQEALADAAEAKLKGSRWSDSGAIN